MKSLNSNYTFPKANASKGDPKVRLERTQKLAYMILQDTDDLVIKVAKTPFASAEDLASAFTRLGCTVESGPKGTLTVTRSAKADFREE